MKTITTAYGKTVKIYAKTFEFKAYDQIKRLANYEAYKDATIRIMPDVHAGKGCTVGTTMTITDKVTPNLVGVDIGCGILTIELKETEIDCKKLDEVIHKHIPSGFNIHKKPKATFNFESLLCASNVDLKRALLSIGTLGGGNHFIEIDYSSTHQKYYLIIHSGSRKVGGDVCKYYQDLAFSSVNEMKVIKENLAKKLKAEGRLSELSQELKTLKKPKADKQLAHLTGENFNHYLHDIKIVQEYASLNRKTIADIILKEMGFREANRFETVHNYIDFKRMILRKGAISAEREEKLLIPINMKDGSLICIGKGNSEWNYSAPHGAGRLISRKEAKREISIDDFTSSMKDVYSTSVNKETLDEAPQAYKPKEEIINAITETVEIIDTLQPIYNFKAS